MLWSNGRDGAHRSAADVLAMPNVTLEGVVDIVRAVGRCAELATSRKILSDGFLLLSPSQAPTGFGFGAIRSRQCGVRHSRSDDQVCKLLGSTRRRDGEVETQWTCQDPHRHRVRVCDLSDVLHSHLPIDHFLFPILSAGTRASFSPHFQVKSLSSFPSTGRRPCTKPARFKESRRPRSCAFRTIPSFF